MALVDGGFTILLDVGRVFSVSEMSTLAEAMGAALPEAA